MGLKAKDSGKPSGSEKASRLALSTIKAIASLHPITGAAAAFIFDQLPDARLKRLQDFLLRLDEDLTRTSSALHKLELDVSTIHPTIELITYKVLNEPRQQKIDCYRAILINEIVGFVSTDATKECMLNLVESLSTLQIQMLSFMSSPVKYLQAYEIPESRITGGFEQMFRTVFPSVEIDVIKAEYKKLYDYSLFSTDVNIFSTMTSAQGLRLLEGRLTSFGKLFVSYLSLREN
jgi:hypothetical protein